MAASSGGDNKTVLLVVTMHSSRIRFLLIAVCLLLPACSVDSYNIPERQSSKSNSNSRSDQPSSDRSNNPESLDSYPSIVEQPQKTEPATVGSLKDAVAFAESLPKSLPELKPKSTEPSVYITRTGSKYHAGGCRYLRKSSIPISLSSARSRYSACSVCGGGGGSVRVGKPATWENASYDDRTAEWTVTGVFNGNRTEAIVFLNRQNRWSLRSLKIGRLVVFRDRETPSQSKLWDVRVEAKRIAQEKLDMEKAAKEKAKRERQTMTVAQRAKEEKLRKIAHNEQRAASRLRLAKTLKDKQKRIKWYKDIIKNYAGTKAAKDAAKLLKETRKPPLIKY